MFTSCLDYCNHRDEKLFQTEGSFTIWRRSSTIRSLEDKLQASMLFQIYPGFLLLLIQETHSIRSKREHLRKNRMLSLFHAINFLGERKSRLSHFPGLVDKMCFYLHQVFYKFSNKDSGLWAKCDQLSVLN